MEWITEIVTRVPYGIYFLAIGFIVWKVAYFYFIRFQGLEKKVSEDFLDLKNNINNNLGPDLKDIRERFGNVESRVSDLWKDRLAPASSPRQLNDVGNKILNNSGIKDIIDQKKIFLLDLIKKNPPTNPYDTESLIMKLVTQLPTHCPDIVDKLKEGAFNSGADISALLFVGGIYFRDLIFSDLGFDLNELDKSTV